MDLNIYIQLVFLSVVNILFAFSGIVLNTLVIASFWKSSQLRKKVCHFMIMVLSCFDLVSVIVGYPGILLSLIFWFKEDYDFLLKIMIYADVACVFIGFSLWKAIWCKIQALKIYQFQQISININHFFIIHSTN